MVVATCMAEDILNRVHPNEAGYKIEGDFNYKIEDGRVKYELSNVVPTGMDIIVTEKNNERNVLKEDVFIGTQPERKEVMFSFDKIVPQDGFPGFQNISYWYYDPEIKLWQPDLEIKKGEQNTELRKDITIMLIIDCSNSLGKDFSTVKSATLGFIKKMYDAAPKGNVHIGIVAFSSIPDTKEFPMQPLNSYSYSRMDRFVRDLGMSNGTALFYAWDKAMEMTNNYIAGGTMTNYDKDRISSHFITFTDGIDQTSQDINRPDPIVSADDYYNYIVKTTKNRISNYESDVVFAKGVDITNDMLQAKFENKLRQLARPNDSAHFEILESVDRLKAKFEAIANRLTDSWKSLNLYVAPARQGHVCWTFGKAEKVKEKPAQCYSKHMLTFDVGANFIFDGYFYYGFDFGFNYAYQLKPKFGIGGYTSFECVIWHGQIEGFQNQSGLTLTSGNLCEKKVMFVGGLGLNLGNCLMGADVRSGFVCRNGFFMLGEVGVGEGVRNEFAIDVSLHFGYNFGRHIKK